MHLELGLGVERRSYLWTFQPVRLETVDLQTAVSVYDDDALSINSENELCVALNSHFDGAS